MVMLSEDILRERYGEALTDLLNELEGDPETLSLFIEFHPGFWEDLTYQGFQCLELDQLPQALSIFQFLQAHHPEEVSYNAACADALCGMKRYFEAEIFYQKTIHLCPEVPDAYFYLAEIKLLRDELEEAQELFESVMEMTQEEEESELRTKADDYLKELRNGTYTPKQVLNKEAGEIEV